MSFSLFNIYIVADLRHAILLRLIDATGRTIVVEGVGQHTQMYCAGENGAAHDIVGVTNIA